MGVIRSGICRLQPMAAGLLIFVLSTPGLNAAVTLTSASYSALRAALSTGGTIILAFDGSIAVTNTLQISFDTLIDATGHTVTLNGANGAGRIFDVPSGVNFTAKNLILSGGSSVGTNGPVGKAGANRINTGENGGDGGMGGDGMGGAVRNYGNTALINCTLQGNRATGGGGGAGGAGGDGGFEGGHGGEGGDAGRGYGGAIYNAGTLALTNCAFMSNAATGGAGGVGGKTGSGTVATYVSGGGVGGQALGGAIYNESSVVAINCLFYANSATSGGTAAAGNRAGGERGRDGQRGSDAFGGGVFNSGTYAVINSTFSGNTLVGGKGGDGGGGQVTGGVGGDGGLALGGGICSSGQMGITNCTLASSMATGGTNGLNVMLDSSPGQVGAARGDQISVTGGTLVLKNSIVAASAFGGNVDGLIVDAGNNISSDASPVFQLASSRNSTDPKLDFLFDNGGPTMTIALLRGSPAIDAAEDFSFLKFDQRGSVRPIGPHADIGAYEFGFVTLTLSGYLTLGTAPLPGVTVTADNFSTVTDATGRYSFALAAGTYLVTPQPSTNFVPASRSVVLNTNVTNINFAGKVSGKGSIEQTSGGQLRVSFGIPLAVDSLRQMSFVTQASTNLRSWENISTNDFSQGDVIQLTEEVYESPARFFRLILP